LVPGGRAGRVYDQPVNRNSGSGGGPVRLSVSVPVGAPPEVVWDATVDWERQSTWMTATRVRGTVQGGKGVGGGIEAFTGVGPLGFLDTMVITEWEPPHRCAVRHTGRVVRGTGAFEVVAADGGGSTLTWWEELDLPAGPLGRAAWPLMRPLARFGVARSLARLATELERTPGG
jgi:uncharacterized protein YndB with AHSA1/START domain